MREGWKYKKFGEVASFSRGLTYSKGDVAVDSSKKVLRSNNIDLATHSLNFDDVACLKEEFVIPVEKMLQQNDIFICMSNGSTQHLGKVAFIDKKMDYAFGGFMGAVHPKVNDIFPKYAFYFCLSSEYRRLLASVLNGININNLKWSDLSKFPIPVPPLSEQQRIVNELDLLSSIIEKKKAQLKEYDQLAQSIFYDMFGDPVENEKGWEVKKMGEIGTFQRGGALQRKDFVENGFPCIHYGQLHTSFGAFTKKHITCISEDLYLHSRIAHKNDLILALTSEDVEGSCKSTAWLGDYDIAIGSDAAIFSHNQNAVYLSFYTRTKAFYHEKEKYAHGFKVTHIKTSEIAIIPVPLPPLSLQQSFASKIEAIERQKALVQQSITEAETLFNSRMDYCFS